MLVAPMDGLAAAESSVETNSEGEEEDNDEIIRD
jgi:hypothetical protein